MSLFKNFMRLPLHFKALCFCIGMSFLSSSPTLGIRFYLPVFLPTLFIGFICLFKKPVKLTVTHLFILVMMIAHIIKIERGLMGFGEKSMGIISVNLLIFFFFLFSMFKMNIEELKSFTNSFILACTGYAVYLFLFAFPVGAGHYSIKPMGGIYDVMEPNYLAAFMALPVIIILKRVIYNKTHTVFNLILLFTNLLALFIIGSRAAMLSVFIAFVLFLLFKPKIRMYMMSFLAGLFGILLSLIFVPEEAIQRLFAKSYFDGSNSMRLVYWKTSFLYTLNHAPIFGVGFGETRSLFGLETSHNTFLGFFVNGGIVSFLSFMGILFFIFPSWRNKDLLLFYVLFASFFFVYFMIPASISLSFWATLLLLYYAGQVKCNYPEVSLWDNI